MAITVFTNEDDPAAHEISKAIEAILLKPAPDPNTAKYLGLMKTVYGQLMRGNLDRALLTSDANAYFTAQAVADYAASLKPLGAPVSIDETGAQLRGGMSYRFYRVKTASKVLTISAFIAPDGKLDEFLVYPAPL